MPGNWQVRFRGGRGTARCPAYPTTPIASVLLVGVSLRSSDGSKRRLSGVSPAAFDCLVPKSAGGSQNDSGPAWNTHAIIHDRGERNRRTAAHPLPRPSGRQPGMVAQRLAHRLTCGCLLPNFGWQAPRPGVPDPRRKGDDASGQNPSGLPATTATSRRSGQALCQVGSRAQLAGCCSHGAREA